MLTALDIERGIQGEIAKTEELVDEIREAGDQAANAEVAYRVASAKALLKIRALNTREKLTVSEVEARVELEIATEHLAHEIAQSRLTTARDALRAAQARLDGWRSLGASLSRAVNG